MVGDGGLHRPFRHQAALVDQPPQQLGVVDDLVVAAQVGVLAGQGVEAVGAGGDPFLAPTPSKVSMFCWAWSWYRYSLPSRRAGSPVQNSRGPSTAKRTPARCSRPATALAVPLARSSRAAARPTQYRYSTSSGAGR